MSKYFLLFIFLSVELGGCAAIGESEVTQVNVEDLDAELQEYIETEDINNVMHIFADGGNSDYIVFKAPGATLVNVEESEERFLDIHIEEPDEGGADVVHVYELMISTDIDTLRYYINGEETHIESLVQ